MALTQSLVQGWAQLLSKQVGGYGAYPVPCTGVGSTPIEAGGRVWRLPSPLYRGGLNSYRSRWEGRALTQSLVQGWAQLLSKQVGGYGAYPVPCTGVGSTPIEAGGRVGHLPSLLYRGGLNSYRSRWEGRALTQSLAQGWGSTPIEAGWRVGQLPSPLYWGWGSAPIEAGGRVGCLPSPLYWG